MGLHEPPMRAFQHSMKSPLRTALALFRANSPAEREQTSERSGSARSANGLRRAVADAVQNPYLPAPEVFDADAFPDPTDVADYFDHPAENGRAARLYEDACLKSDILLAEAACCDEILNVRLQQPIRAAKNCRVRLYAIASPPNEAKEPSVKVEKERSVPNHREPRQCEPRRNESRRSESAEDWSWSRQNHEPTEEKTAEAKSHPLFYSEEPDRKSPRSAAPDERFPKSDSPDIPTASEPTPPRKKKSYGIESLFLTFLIFGLILWLAPMAKNRLFPESAPDASPQNATLAPETAEPTSPSCPLASGLPSGFAEVPPPVSLPIAERGNPLAPRHTETQRFAALSEVGPETKKAPPSEEDGTWKPLSLAGTDSNPLERGQNGIRPNHQPPLTIPERNNNVFQK